VRYVRVDDGVFVADTPTIEVNEFPNLPAARVLTIGAAISVARYDTRMAVPELIRFVRRMVQDSQRVVAVT